MLQSVFARTVQEIFNTNVADFYHKIELQMKCIEGSCILCISMKIKTLNLQKQFRDLVHTTQSLGTVYLESKQKITNITKKGLKRSAILNDRTCKIPMNSIILECFGIFIIAKSS